MILGVRKYQYMDIIWECTYRTHIPLYPKAIKNAF